MFDVNLNQIERDALYGAMSANTEEAYEEVLSMVENLLEMRFNRGKRQGATRFRDMIIDSIVSELQG